MSTPITAFYGGLLAVTFVYLSILVINQRRALKVSLGQGDNPHFAALVRSHANFAEYVPLCLVLLLIAEINHHHAYWLHGIGALLLFGRLLHAYGLRHHIGASWQRVCGMLMTFAALLIAALLNILMVY